MCSHTFFCCNSMYRYSCKAIIIQRIFILHICWHSLFKKLTLSYIISNAKFKYTLTEHRIRFAILDNLKALSGVPNNLEIRNHKFRMHKPQNIHAWEVELPMSDILKYMGSENTPKKNYQLIEDAAESIQKKIFKVKNTETGEFLGCTAHNERLYCPEIWHDALSCRRLGNGRTFGLQRRVS